MAEVTRLAFLGSLGLLPAVAAKVVAAEITPHQEIVFVQIPHNFSHADTHRIYAALGELFPTFLAVRADTRFMQIESIREGDVHFIHGSVDQIISKIRRMREEKRGA